MTSGTRLPAPHFYRVDEVARILRISLATAYRRIEDGSIPSRIIGGVIRVPIVEFRRAFQLDSQEPQ